MNVLRQNQLKQENSDTKYHMRRRTMFNVRNVQWSGYKRKSRMKETIYIKLDLLIQQKVILYV